MGEQLKVQTLYDVAEIDGKNLIWTDVYVSGTEGASGVYATRRMTWTQLVDMVAQEGNFEWSTIYNTPTSINDYGISSFVGLPCEIQLAVSDETTALTTGTGKLTFRMPHAMTLTEVRASLTTAGSTSGTTTIDVNEGGISILSTKLTIDATEKTSTTATTPAVISDSSLADDAEITIDIDAISGGATEAGLKILLKGTRA